MRSFLAGSRMVLVGFTAIALALCGVGPARADARHQLVAPQSDGTGAGPPQQIGVQHVIHISVDGLRGDLLQQLIQTDVNGDFQNFRRLTTEGSATFNARTDYTQTVTMPNHASMLTGRPAEQPAGQPSTVHHGYLDNGTAPLTATIHNSGNPNLNYIASVFDVVHDHGLSTALYASKSKFQLFDQSWNALSGALDPIAVDDGRDKIDVYLFRGGSGARNTHDNFVRDMGERLYNYVFLCYRDPDGAGHAHSWGSPQWARAVHEVDVYLGEIFHLIHTHPLLQGRTAIVLTADHGGIEANHHREELPACYTIPFAVWGPGVPQNTDLYALNATRRADPGTERPDYNAMPQPLRNGDSGNLALDLLGLGPVPGSTINAAQDLIVSIPTSVLGASPSRMSLVVANPATRELRVRFALVAETPATLEVFDVNGRRLRALILPAFDVSGERSVGSGLDLANGVYFVRLRQGPWSRHARITLVR